MSDEFWRALMDPTAPLPHGWPVGALGAFLLFLVPIGGGIPAGVLLGHDAGVSPPMLAFLYFCSDIVLAFVFEPFIWVLTLIGRWIPILGRLGRAIAGLSQRAGLQGESGKGPLGLILVAFTVDPMTGRAAAAAAGHGFVGGWAIAIAGDMLYFTVLMASTIWLHGVLGDERLTVGAVLLLMIIVPALVRRWRARNPAVSGVSVPRR